MDQRLISDSHKVYDSKLWLASEWSFLAEGGQHLVCRYIGLTDSLQGMLLRFRKCSGECIAQRNQHSQLDAAYQELVVTPLFAADAEYIVNYSNVLVPSEFVDEIAAAIESIRPHSRKRLPLRLPAEHTAVSVQLLRDASVLSEPSEHVISSLAFSDNQLRTIAHKENYEKYWAFDIKVKSGIQSTSPFVPATRSVKRQFGRYSLMQCTKRAILNRGGVLNGDILWDPKALSPYNPADLCSGDYKRIRSALQALVVSPQNNLKAFAKANLVYSSVSDNWDKACQLMASGPYAEGIVLESATAVLCTEQVLPILQRIQMIDILEAEGASIVFARLKRVLCCDVETAENFVVAAAVTTPVGSMSVAMVARLLQQWIQAPHASAERQLLEDQMPSCVSALLRLGSSFKDSPGANLAHARNLEAACSMIDSMDEWACATLLNLYLLGLSAQDASVLISFAELPFKNTDLTTRAQDPSGAVCRAHCAREGLAVIHASVFSTQEQNKPGIVELRCECLCRDSRGRRVTTTRKIAYAARVIDMGIKAASKCWKKANAEYEVCVNANAECKAYQATH